MSRVSDFGNDLYTGRRGLDYVGRRKIWFAISAIFLAIAVGTLAVRGLNLGLEFRGGSEFRVGNVAQMNGFETRAKDAVTSVTKDAGNVSATQIGQDNVRVTTERMTERTSAQVAKSLAKTFDVDQGKVSSSLVGPSWGASVTKQAVNALLIFLVVVAAVLAAYFRTWKMSLAAILAMIHDILLTVGLYTLVGFEITPATMIGFLTILAYSLYDTVVVFDKVKENVRLAAHTGHHSYSQAANLAVNQTLVRSINTSMMSVIPVTVVLVVGLTLIGPGVLLDLALVLLVGIIAGAYSSVFIATPILAMLREREPGMKELAKRAHKYQDTRGGANFSGVLHRELASHSTHNTMLDESTEDDEREAEPVGAAGGATARSADSGGDVGRARPSGGARRPIHPSLLEQGGPRDQPKKKPRSKR